MLADRALAMLSAGLRHVRDAQYLVSCELHARSPDQAYHLAGFGPECARKATLPRSTFDQAIGHGVTGTSEQALNVALALDPIARRYDLQEWASRYPALAGWNERVRYDRTGANTEQNARTLVTEAADIVEKLAYALWADGLLPETFSW